MAANEDTVLLSAQDMESAGGGVGDRAGHYQAIPTPAQAMQIVSLKDALKMSLGVSSMVSLTLFIGTAGNYLNTVLLARIDDEHRNLQAANLINSFSNVVITSSSAILFSISTAVTHAIQNPEEIAAIVRNGALLTIPFTCTSCALILNSGSILKLLRQPEDLAQISQKYYETFSFGVPAMLLLGVEQQLCLGTFNFAPVNFSSLANVLMTAGIGSILIYPLKLNAAGLGYASSISAWLTLAGLTIYLKKSDRFINIPLFSMRKCFDKDILYRLFRMGLPIGIQMGSEFTAIIASTAIIGAKLNDKDLGANEIAMQYLFLTIVPIFGIGQACNYLTGQSAGQNNFKNVATYAKACLYLGNAAAFLALALFSSIPKQLMSPFIDVHDPRNDGLVETTKYLLILNGANQVFDAIRVIAAGAIQGAYQKTDFAMVSGIVGMCIIGVPVGYVLGIPAGLGVVGIYVGRGIGQVIAGSSVFCHWRNRIIRSINATDPPLLSEVRSNNGPTEGIDQTSHLEQEGLHSVNSDVSRAVVFSDGARRSVSATLQPTSAASRSEARAAEPPERRTRRMRDLCVVQ